MPKHKTLRAENNYLLQENRRLRKLIDPSVKEAADAKIVAQSQHMRERRANKYKLQQSESLLRSRVQKMEVLFVEAKKALAENEQYRRLYGRLPSVCSITEETSMADRLAAVAADSILGCRSSETVKQPRLCREGNR